MQDLNTDTDFQKVKKNKRMKKIKTNANRMEKRNSLMQIDSPWTNWWMSLNSTCMNMKKLHFKILSMKIFGKLHSCYVKMNNMKGKIIKILLNNIKERMNRSMALCIWTVAMLRKPEWWRINYEDHSYWQRSWW